MNVYVAKINYDYEGYDLVGVFTTEDKAKKALQNPDLIKGDGTSIDIYCIDELSGEGKI